MARAAFSDFNTGGNQVGVNRSTALAAATLVDDNGPATATAVATGTEDAQGVAAAAGLRLMGYSISETGGTPAVATVVLRNGVADTAAVLSYEELAASGSVTRWFGPQGIACPLGIFIERAAGETAVVLYHKTSA